jgi:hypothetical protein
MRNIKKLALALSAVLLILCALVTSVSGLTYYDDQTSHAPTAPPQTETLPSVTIPPTTSNNDTIDEPTVPNVNDVHTHEYITNVTQASCISSGFTTYICECGDTYEDNFVNPFGHAYNKEIVPPTCAMDGYTVYTCKLCNDEYVDEKVDAVGHDYSVKVIDPTCLEKGYTTYQCNVCDETYIGDYVDAIGHNYDKTVVSPTCHTEGYAVYSCINCSDEYTSDYIDPIEHNYHSDVVYATCTEDGYTINECQYCSYKYTSNVIKAHGHNYLRAIVDPTCELEGFTIYSCEYCMHEYVGNYVDAIGHRYDKKVINPTCESNGYTTYTCCACGDNYKDDLKDAIGHNYTAQTVKPTCESDGYTKYVCELCNYTYTSDRTAKIGHNWSDWEIVIKPTQYVDGSKTRHCYRCNDSETETIKATGKKTITLQQGALTMSEMLTAPTNNDFNEYYEQALILYTVIMNGDPGEYDKWPNGVYGPKGYAHVYLPIDGLSTKTYSQQEDIADRVVDHFSGLFNQKVLNGCIWLSFNMYDVVGDGVSVHIDPVKVHNRVQEQLKNSVYYDANIKAGLYDGMSERDAVIAINKWICNNVSYESGSDAMTVLNTKKAQCAGYASLFYQMCLNAGIKCEYIVGCIDGDEDCLTCHAWNRVKVDGKWYWVDVCWNDTGSKPDRYLLSETLWSPRIVCN